MPRVSCRALGVARWRPPGPPVLPQCCPRCPLPAVFGRSRGLHESSRHSPMRTMGGSLRARRRRAITRPGTPYPQPRDGQRTAPSLTGQPRPGRSGGVSISAPSLPVVTPQPGCASPPAPPAHTACLTCLHECRLEIASPRLRFVCSRTDIAPDAQSSESDHPFHSQGDHRFHGQWSSAGAKRRGCRIMQDHWSGVR